MRLILHRQRKEYKGTVISLRSIPAFVSQSYDCGSVIDNAPLFPDNHGIMTRSLQQIRNIGIIAHIDAGQCCYTGRTVKQLYYFVQTL